MSNPPAGGEPYRRAILQEAPRVLGLMDREPFSPTLGCCDRSYWAWKFVDFPGARFQEALCVLSFLFATPLEDNPYTGNERLQDWIGHGLHFWTSIQYSDGSFDEAYPFERSLAATAFTAFYVSEALLFMQDALPSNVRDKVRQTLDRAGRWLIANDETHGFLSNHLAAAAAALYHIYQLTGAEAFERRSNAFLQRILDHQSVEGWYEEYGGADPGYQTHATFYLARLWQLSGNEALGESLALSTRFLAHFVHPDGSLGGEYASRNTQTYYPAGFEMLARRDSAAAWIATTMRPKVLSGVVADLRSVDRYNYFPFLNNFVFAYLAAAQCSLEEAVPPATIMSPGPADQPGLSWFPEAGLARVRHERYDAYVGTAKGGVIKIYDRLQRRLVYSDCGYLGQLRSGQVISSQYQDNGRQTVAEPDHIAVEGTFVVLSRPIMTPVRFTAFRIFILILGRIPRLAQWLKRYLVRVLIYKKRPLELYIHRSIDLSSGMVTVSDRIGGRDADKLDSLQWGQRFTTIHMGSARYFINSEMHALTPPDQDAVNEIDPSQVAAGVAPRRVVRFDGEEA